MWPSIILSVVVLSVGTLVAWRRRKLDDAAISLLSTLLAALLALATYFYSLRTADEGERERLQHLLGLELETAERLVQANAKQWKQIERSGEAATATSYAIVPTVVAPDALRSGLFTDLESPLLEYLLAVERYNKTVGAQLDSLARGTLPGGSEWGLVARINLLGAYDVHEMTVKLLRKLPAETSVTPIGSEAEEPHKPVVIEHR